MNSNKVRQSLLKTQSETLGRIIPIPRRGSILDKLGWVVALIGAFGIIYLLVTQF